MKILVVTADLFFSPTIITIAKRLGMTVELIGDKARVMEKVRSGPAAVIFDLNYAAADPVALIREIKASAETREILTIAFVSHVQTELKQSAKDAGCDEVLARSVFAERLPGLLAGRNAPQSV